MMAAEVNEPTSVEAPALSSSDAVHKINDNSQNGGSGPPSVTASGSPDELANKHIADIIDDLVNSAEPSISGGSDTETTRRDAAKSSDGDSGHVRTSSTARKPATFKTVSVNKTFLAAKAAAGSSSTPKPSDTASPVLSNASLSTTSVAGSARPRLVAKTGLVKGANANGRPAAAPDPNTVWNKNQPVPPPEPRKLTDEELKKYGIHVATRLQQDDTKGQANNWADIDDDDEDWAPEEITWTDGTKSTIPHHEEQHQLAQQTDGIYDVSHHHPAQASAQASSAQPSPIVPESGAPAASKDVATDGKLAPAGVRAGGLPSGKGLIFKNAPERPTLVAKPPAPPTPVKSPWAQLPPVDKAPPVAADLPPYNANSRMPYQQGPPHYQQHHHQYQHRDVSGGPPRGSTPPQHHYKEIAADDFSRSSFRDGHANMNRELFNSQSGRLEPVGDRRGSFRNDYRQGPSVLQRSGHGHPMDQQPEPSAAFQSYRSGGQEGPYGRRRNSSNVSGGSGSYARMGMGRQHDQHIPAEHLNARRPSMTGRSDSPASPNFSGSGPQPWRGSPNIAHAGPYSHGQPPNAAQHVPSPNPIPAQTVPGNAAAAEAVPPIDDIEFQKKLMRERLEAAKKRRVEEEEREEAAKRERIRLKLEAMGPAPERKSAKKEAAKEEASSSAAATPITPAQSFAKLNASSEEHTPPDDPRKAQRPVHGGDGPASDANASGHEMQRQLSQQAQHEPWQGAAATPQTERIASWGSSNQSLRNVWGSPNNRSLGNGTFISDLGRVTDPYAQQKAGPGPIGPPPPAPIGPPKIAALVSATAPGQGPGASPPAAAGSANATRSAWANAVKASDDNLLLQQKAHRADQQREAESRGLTLNDIRPTIKDTWMPTRLNEDGNRVEDKTNQSVVHRAGTTVAATSTTPTPPIHPQQARPSRFFPTRDARADDTPSAGSPVPPATSSTPTNGVHYRPGSPSPPPPDMDGHPAFDGDALHPHVSLPRPQIVVRLPPKHNGSAAAEASYTHHAQTRSSGHSSQEDGHWQAKFDSLLKLGSAGKSAASPARPDVHSRHPVDITSPTTSPTALYTTSRGPTRYVKPAPKEPVMTRPMAEECFERQEMGSLPPVHLPNKVPELAWNPAPAPKSVPRRFQVAAMTSSDHESVIQDLFSPLHSVNIILPGMAGSGKTVTLPDRKSVV